MAEPNRLAAALSYEQDRPAFGNPSMLEQGRKMRERKQAEQVDRSAQNVKSDLLARALMYRYNPETLTGLTDTPGPQTLDEAAGLDPRVDRSTFLPYSKKEGLHVPAVVADVMKLATASNPQYSNLMQPDEAMPLATNMMGGGVVASRLAPAPAGSLGMNVTPRGRIPKTGSDVEKLADLLEKRAESAGIEMATDKSKISPSRYIEFTKPDGEPYKVRISNHLDVHGGNDISVDPHSMNTFEEAIALLKENGISIPDRKIIDRSLNNQANKAWLWSQFQGKEKPPYKLGSQEYREATDYANALYDKQKNGTLTKQDIDKFYAMHRDKSAEEK